MLTEKYVLNFIARFSNNGQNIDTINTFTCGCCYWFAVILHQRFSKSTIMYDGTINHFGTQINGKVYDITGDVTQNYRWIPWEDFNDELEKQRIIRDCIEF